MNLTKRVLLLILISYAGTYYPFPISNVAFANHGLEKIANEPTRQAPSPAPIPEQESSFVFGWKLTRRSFKETNRKLSYSIEGVYPQVSNSTDPRALRLNQEIKRSIARRYTYMTAPDPKEFRERIRNARGELLETAEFKYEVMIARDDLLSIRFSETTYSLWAAHPLHGYFTVNYEVKSGKLLDLNDIFKPNTDYLKMISRICAEKFEITKGSPWEDAVSPKRKNFESWNIIKEGIEINFDKCVVMGCSAGAQKVVIHYDDLKEYLNPKNVVFRLAR